MLGPEYRKKLSARGWLHIENTDKNPTQTWHRIKNKTDQAIRDFVLLSHSLPIKKNKEIFNKFNLAYILSSFLSKEKGYNETLEIRSINANLAALMVDVGIACCIKEYHQLNKDTPALAQPTIDHLHKASEICREISYRLQLDVLEEKAEEEQLIFLFRWKEITGKRLQRLDEYVKVLLDHPVVYIEQNPVIKDKEISGKLIERFADDFIECGSFGLTLDTSRNTGKLKIKYERASSKYVERDLIIKEEGKDIFIYTKKENRKETKHNRKRFRKNSNS